MGDVFFFWISFLGPKNRWYQKITHSEVLEKPEIYQKMVFLLPYLSMGKVMRGRSVCHIYSKIKILFCQNWFSAVLHISMLEATFLVPILGLRQTPTYLTASYHSVPYITLSYLLLPYYSRTKLLRGRCTPDSGGHATTYRKHARLDSRTLAIKGAMVPLQLAW